MPKETDGTNFGMGLSPRDQGYRSINRGSRDGINERRACKEKGYSRKIVKTPQGCREIWGKLITRSGGEKEINTNREVNKWAWRCRCFVASDPAVDLHLKHLELPAEKTTLGREYGLQFFLAGLNLSLTSSTICLNHFHFWFCASDGLRCMRR